MPRYSFMRQNTTTDTGARLAIMPTAVSRTAAGDQVSVLSMTAPNAAMATISRSTNTMNMDRLSTGTSYILNAVPLRMMANSS